MAKFEGDTTVPSGVTALGSCHERATEATYSLGGAETLSPELTHTRHAALSVSSEPDRRGIAQPRAVSLQLVKFGAHRRIEGRRMS